ncbi:protein ELYS homolog [Zeugodacus cucurbitae]|uniref:protein ELYS homolog n=1 Tax=Zeugodacus cucurbitae TaxID=28588 RepID=UPI0023D945DB|nr:protein ELYS homolog [Zeugodacus cucurbitae]
MEWYEIAVDGGRTVKFSTRVPHLGAAQHQEQKQLEQGDNDAVSEEECLEPQQGGIIKRGNWCWLSSGNELEIRALRTGQTIATYEFVETRGYDSCYIRCVEELFPFNNETVLLAVCLDCFSAPGRSCSFIAIYSIEHSQVLSCIELPLHITAAAFVGENCCRRSLLQNFDGCLAVGSEEGVILLLDLNINKIISACDERVKAPTRQLTNEITACHISDYNLPLAEIHRSFQRARNDNVHFGLQVEVIDTPCTVQCLLPIDLSLGLAIGLEDGRLAFYDLAEMQIIHIATPKPQQAITPIVKLCYLEPLDDPRHCLYVWAMHENGDSLSAVLHTLIYDKRLSEKDGFYYFESFLTGSARLQLPLEKSKSIAIGCQSINKIQNASLQNNGVNLNTTQTEEDGYCLCALTWYSTQEEKNKLLIFDLNQWYKEEMPSSIMNQKCPSYLAGYVLSGRQCALSAYLNPSTVAHFNSLQRFEEHFYPNSLSFDCLLLLPDSSLGYTWIGAQNKIINVLRASNSSIFLEPDMYFREILRTRLLPQFCELNVDSTFSRLAIFETILSVALEHNCFSLLRDCAKCWADGSFMGCNFTATTGISLSTLTDWIWKRATDIKTRCNDLSKGLFDYAGYPLDQREQKELGFLTRQLKLLGDLLSEVLTTGKRYIPDNVYLTLETQQKSLKMASEYQDVLLWLLNIGLLPEMQENRNNFSSYKPYGKSKNVHKSNQPNANTIQYPYDDLKNLYARRREFFARSNDNFISKKTGSCRLLFIDALIAHECKGDGLRECWLENGGTGLYPPPSIEAMLRVMLVPEMEFESKCAILLYFFLDLHMTIDEQAHKEIVDSFVKFPSVFKLTVTLIKTVQSLWNLDHGLFQPAVDEFISPFNNNQTYSQWMLELLIESLLTQNAAHFALRILEARPTLISPVLKLKTLLANKLISEAFHFARTKQDDTLLELFFKCCLCAGKYGVIRDLALNEREGQLVQRILRSSKTLGAENLHFVYLLQKSKYIEAVSYMDELSRTKSLRGHYGNESSIAGNTDTPNLVLSAFNTTMAPVTQGLTDVYFRIKNKIKKKETDNRSPVPLSCQLIKQNANNLLGGIYHSSALSAHFATYYWGEIDSDRRERNGAPPPNSLLSANNAPFLRKPQVDACHLQLEQSAQTGVSYPQPYRATEKRTLVERELEQADVPDDVSNIMLNTNMQPRKRRRLLGQEIVDDLSHFMQLNKSAQHLTARGFDLKDVCEAKVKVSEPTANATTEYLTQPLSTPRRRLVACDESRGDLSVASELHSILKTSNTPERSLRAHSARRELHTAMDESKNLRFNLEVTNIVEEKEETAAEKRDMAIKLSQAEKVCALSAINKDRDEVVRIRRVVTTTVDDESVESVRTTEQSVKVAEVPKESTQEDVEMAEDDAVDELLIEVRHERSPAVTHSPITKHKSVARAVSVESNASKNNKSSVEDEDDDDEDEDFFSPLSSRNNSLLMDSVRSPISSQLSTSISSAYETATSKLFRFSGPQARKPLARLSVERSQSRTPEKQTPSEENIEECEKKESEVEIQKSTQSDIANQPSSGYVSVCSSSISKSVSTLFTDKPTFQIKSVMSLASSDFVPHSSSSKIAATQSKFNFEETKPLTHRGKLSECSTMVGSFSVEESAFATETDKVDEVTNDRKVFTQFKTPTELAHPKAAHPLQADTTLGMSSYDFTMPDTKSEHLLDSTNTAEVSVKHKNVNLKVMETVEVMDTDEQVEDTQNVAVTTESDLHSDAFGLPVQQQTTDWNIDESEDSNDVVALYENKSEAVEKHRNYQAANDSDSDVIILSSSPSSPNIHGDQASDTDSESDDGDENAYGDDGEEEDENESEEEDRIYSKDASESSSSSIEIIEESNSSAGNKFEEEDSRSIAEEPITVTVSEVVASVVMEDENEYPESKANDEEEIVTHTKDVSNESSMHSICESVESESRIVVEEIAASCVDYEELVMRETVIFDESEDGERTSSSNTQELSSYFSKSVIAQKDGEIIIEELKVSAYSASSKEIYEELGDDVFYCDAETTNDSVETNEAASTSAGISKRISVAEKPTGESAETDDVPKVEIDVPVCSETAISKQISEVTEKPADESSEAADEPKVKVDVPAYTENAETYMEIKGKESVEETQVTIAVKNDDTKELEEEEEQIKLHVDEDLSEAEAMDVEEGATDNTPEPSISVTVEKEKLVETVTKVEELEATTLQSGVESHQKPTLAAESPKDNQLEEKQESKMEHTEKQTSPQKSSEPTDKSLNSTQTSVSIEVNSLKRTRVTSPLEENETDKLSSTPTRDRYNRRGTSVPPPPSESAVNTPIEEVSTPRRNTRGISMPPQTTAQQEEEASVHTPSRRRNKRASSVQPSEESAAQPGTPRTRRSIRGVSVPHDVDETAKSSTPVRTGRGTSVPPPATIVTRRRSALLEAINESTPIVDSPSTRTRSRIRLNSVESELDSSIVSGGGEQAPQTKRTRRSSVSSSVSEQPTTPSSRRTRRSNIAATVPATVAEATTEVGTPRSLRRTTRRVSMNAENLDATQPLEEHEHETEETSESNKTTTESALYSSARRLTRTQLAMMEKSAALIKNTTLEGLRSGDSISSPTNKRVSKRRSSRSTVPDSDDVESISSHVSNVSGAQKRRVTRSSMKDKEDNDDDLASIASSVGSERAPKRRSKESKNSPNTTLSTIQEDEAEGEAGQKKRSRQSKKNVSKSQGEPSP